MHRESCRILQNKNHQHKYITILDPWDALMCNFCPGLLILLLCNPCQYQINCGSFDFSAPSSGTFDLEISPHSGEFDQSFIKKSNARRFAQGGGGGGRGGGMITFGIDPDINSLTVLVLTCLLRSFFCFALRNLTVHKFLHH